MCNRFKSKLQAMQIRDLMTQDITLLDDAQSWEPFPHQAPSLPALVIFQRAGDHVMGTATWGFPKDPNQGKGLHINARIESLDTKWRYTTPCYLPVTSWTEYVEENGKNIHHEIGLPGEEPFLVAGICAMREGRRLMAMVMHNAPPSLIYLCTRLPIPYALDAVGIANPVSILDQMEVHRV